METQDAAACTRILEQTLTLRPTPDQQHCTGPVECKQHFSLKLINCSAGDRRLNVSALRTEHMRAREVCDRSGGVLPSGGWCLAPRIGPEKECSGGQYATGCMVRVRATSNGLNSSYFLPKMHFIPDGRVLALVDLLLQPEPAWPRPSLVDIGAGVGQFCSSLLGIDSRRDCRSYDGAGNVQSITRNAVKWVDLSRALSLPRADWVLSVEVGEHMYAKAHGPSSSRFLHAPLFPRCLVLQCR